MSPFNSLIALSLLFMLANGREIEHDNSPLIEPVYKLISKLYPKLQDDGAPQGNLLVSPISIHQALSMVALGAKENSETERQLLEVLDNSDWNSLNLEHRNIAQTFVGKISKSALAARSTEKIDESVVGVRKFFTPLYVPQFEDKFEENLLFSYGKKIFQPYAEGRHSINQKMRDWTRDAGFSEEFLDDEPTTHIVELLLTSSGSLEAKRGDRRLYLNETENIFMNLGRSNQLVQHGKIATAASVPGRSVVHIATNNSSNQGNYSAYNQRHLSNNEFGNISFHAVEVDLRNDLTLAIIEPLAKGAGTELKELTENLLTINSTDGKSNLFKLFQHLDKSDVYFEELTFPAFTIDKEISLVRALKSIGLTRIFDPNEAELSEMNRRHNCSVNQIIQKPSITLGASRIIDEVGVYSEEYEFPGQKVVERCNKERGITVRVDSPFLFVIRFHKIPLFFGQLVDIVQKTQKNEDRKLRLKPPTRVRWYEYYKE